MGFRSHNQCTASYITWFVSPELLGLWFYNDGSRAAGSTVTETYLMLSMYACLMTRTRTPDRGIKSVKLDDINVTDAVVAGSGQLFLGLNIDL